MGLPRASVLTRKHPPGRPLDLRNGPDPVGRCARCWLPPRACICPIICAQTDIRVVVIRHFKEGLKSVNSARLLPLALAGCEIRDYGRMGTSELDIGDLLGPGTALLYPPAVDAAAPALTAPLRVLIVPDGTWAQTRRIVNRSRVLDGVPRLAIAAEARPVRRLLAPPAPWAVSTLEAVGHAFEAVGEPDIGAALLALYDRFSAASLALGRGNARLKTSSSSDE